MQGSISYIIIAVLALALVRAAWGDLKTRTIPNWLNLAIALGAPLWWWANGWSLWPAVTVQLLIFVVIFLIFAGCFAIGAMGGGDVKLIAALSLWLPLTPLIRMLFIMAVLGGIVTLATLLVHKLAKRAGAPEIPYGVAISLAGLWVFANELLTISSP
jgi:Flp pilus assembly protein, protease CpaA